MIFKYSEITEHPCYSLTLKQLEKEKQKTIEFNKNLKYVDKVSLEGINQFIEHKKKNQYIQKKLF